VEGEGNQEFSFGRVNFEMLLDIQMHIPNWQVRDVSVEFHRGVGRERNLSI
jgi:hypothetical protein